LIIQRSSLGKRVGLKKAIGSAGDYRQK